MAVLFLLMPLAVKSGWRLFIFELEDESSTCAY